MEWIKEEDEGGGSDLHHQVTTAKQSNGWYRIEESAPGMLASVLFSPDFSKNVLYSFIPFLDIREGITNVLPDASFG